LPPDCFETVRLHDEAHRDRVAIALHRPRENQKGALSLFFAAAAFDTANNFTRGWCGMLKWLRWLKSREPIYVSVEDLSGWWIPFTCLALIVGGLCVGTIAVNWLIYLLGTM